MTTQTKTIPLTIGRETRDVDCFDVRGDGKLFRSVELVGAFRKHGGKVWTEPVYFQLQADGTFRADRSAVILNSNGYSLVAFADQAPKNRSQHNSAYCAH